MIVTPFGIIMSFKEKQKAKALQEAENAEEGFIAKTGTHYKATFVEDAFEGRNLSSHAHTLSRTYRSANLQTVTKTTKKDVLGLPTEYCSRTEYLKNSKILQNAEPEDIKAYIEITEYDPFKLQLGNRKCYFETFSGEKIEDGMNRINSMLESLAYKKYPKSSNWNEESKLEELRKEFIQKNINFIVERNNCHNGSVRINDLYNHD